jgi:transposase, IS5 family
MPIENLVNSQKQGRMFYDKLSKELNSKHKLYKLKELINWTDLEEEIGKLVKIEQLGRERKSLRVMLGLSMLQAMYNFSDGFTSETFGENVYWKYFCGYEYVDTGLSVSESAIRRFRQELGERGYNCILRELTKVGLRVGAYKKKDLDSAIIDTTVQIKNIKHPHDAYLLGKAREEVVKLAHRLGFKLNDTYERKYKKGLIGLWKYKDASKSKKRIKTMKHLKTLVGRLIRIVDRKSVESNILLAGKDLELFKKIKKIHAQSFLSKAAKEKYKQSGNEVIYSFHAEEVECIGKGKLNKPYEFGNKVALAISRRGNFILGVKSFHGNPYDGNTLSQTVAQMEEITGHEAQKLFVDLGYRGSNYSKKGKIYTPYTKKQLSREDRLMQKRRSTIEPVIGHLKQYGRMGRNYLKGVFGDIVNPLISAIGFNLRGIANKLKFAT